MHFSKILIRHFYHFQSGETYIHMNAVSDAKKNFSMENPQAKKFTKWKIRNPTTKHHPKTNVSNKSDKASKTSQFTIHIYADQYVSWCMMNNNKIIFFYFMLSNWGFSFIFPLFRSFVQFIACVSKCKGFLHNKTQSTASNGREWENCSVRMMHMSNEHTTLTVQFFKCWWKFYYSYCCSSSCQENPFSDFEYK